MKTNPTKLDKILSAIGLNRSTVWKSSNNSVYDKEKFKSYVTPSYLASNLKESDEVYGISEFNLLHIESGLRLTFLTRESEDCETVKYEVIELFVLTLTDEMLEIMDADFEKGLFYTMDKTIPFAEINKSIDSDKIMSVISKK